MQIDESRKISQTGTRKIEAFRGLVCLINTRTYMVIHIYFFMVNCDAYKINLYLTIVFDDHYKTIGDLKYRFNQVLTAEGDNIMKPKANLIRTHNNTLRGTKSIASSN